MVPLRYCFIFYFFTLMSLLGQALAPNEYDFQWQKANGDRFEIEVENNLSKQVVQKRLDRVCMQILLKAMLKSNSFETFIPEKIALFEDRVYNVAELSFTFIDRQDEVQKRIYYYSFDYYGNVFKQIE